MVPDSAGHQKSGRAGRCRAAHAPRCGFTLSETLIAAAVLAILLTAIALGLTTIRTELKREQTVEVLVALDEALGAYEAATGQWPQVAAAGRPQGSADDEQGRAMPSVSSAGGERDDGDAAIALLAELPASRQVLERIPTAVRVPVPGRTGAWTVRDAWGRRLRYLNRESSSLVDREAVAANGGRPIFVSPGDDGEFGGRDRAASADNLRSDELPRHP